MVGVLMRNICAITGIGSSEARIRSASASLSGESLRGLTRQAPWPS
jgi:hypothetical protein